MPRVDWTRQIAYFYISFPDKKEQKAITQYLDKATEDIDMVVTVKLHQLEKLEQYKKAEIHKAVTKGLDKNVKLKEIGFEWIGKIPEHWKVRRIKDEMEYILTGSTPATNVPEYYENGTIKCTLQVVTTER